MKYIRFRKGEEIYYGVVKGNSITQLDGDYITGDTRPLANEFALEEVEVLTPVDPGQVLCIGLNYEAHAEETGKPIPEEPMMFMASPSAVTAPAADIVLPNLEHRIDYEAELVIVIGKEAKDVKKEEALSCIFGYTVGNDVSNRNLQKKDGQFTRAKSFGTFKPLGPVIETELDPNNVPIKLKLNGEVKQESNTNDLIHTIEDLVVKITEVMTLSPGDVIYTGTPSGVGPLSPGDVVEAEVSGIGVLRNQVISK
ncbi:fumarylacetoacetate hydrolase family protein [Halobacillus sp. A5]|uniref:fumarylacetoacetate hydrolase family protein n=1 Tax=Halobacillus sp. A5 TaxID=2880263 RepID=UPI0020A65024|nr:fumarylacetoacetate hydrolase family protein [Halobacillus sp. A5]MCP3028528.1 fumarylacetoacetate hydrolase family protein [Halobacillus sp. A5]